MSSRRSLAVRGLLAVALLIAFYALAIAAATVLAGLGVVILYALFAAHKVNPMVALFSLACIAAALVVLWSILPRIDRFEAPGPELDPDAFPDLFAEIRQLAAATGQAPPRHVYLVADVNAFVTERGGIMGIGSRRVMGIGLGLLQVMTVSELRAILVHELGHFHGGDTKLGPWIYKTRGAVGRTVDNLGRAHDATVDMSVVPLVMRALRAPFVGFGGLFLRITQRISRAQELGADALAVRVVGVDAVVGGFKKIRGGSFAFNAYLHGELAPVLGAGFVPPMAAGFREFMAAIDGAAMMTTVFDETADSDQHDPLDSHPLIRDRIAAAEALASRGQMARDDRPAFALVPGLDGIEPALARAILVEPRPLTAIAWDDTIDRVSLPRWRDHVKGARSTLRGLTPASLPRSGLALSKLAQVPFHGDVDGVGLDELRGWATHLFGTALTLALVGRGARITTGPGAPYLAMVDDVEVKPFVEVAAYLRQETTAADWQARMTLLGIADVDLTTVA